MKKENIAIVLATFAFIFGFIGMVGDKSTSPNVSGVTNYDDLTLSGSLTSATGVFSGTIIATGKGGIGTTTPSTALGDLSVGGTATTTIYIGSGGTKGGCIQTTNDTGTLTKIYVTGTTVTAAAGSCK